MDTVDSLTADLRIVSLIPSATEIVAALGYENCLVGRSHECDFPARVKELPVCTAPKFDPNGSSAQIHERVSELLSSALSVYRVEVDVLKALRPTHIITQAQCDVCAASLGDVEQAANDLMADEIEIEIVSLQPNRLADVWGDIVRVAKAIGDSAAESVAMRLVDELKQTLGDLAEGSAGEEKTVACIEWTEPLMAAGNWVPELVSLAGGRSCFGKAGEHSDWMQWAELVAADPDMIVVMPCGYDLAQARRAAEEMSDRDEWRSLSAVKAGNVYLVDGNQYFNRPGPRLVESGQILAEIIQGRTVDSSRGSAGWETF